MTVTDNGQTTTTALDALSKAKEAISNGLSPEKLIQLIEAGTRRKNRGRRVPEHPEFTFPDSGYIVRVRRLGPWTLDQIRVSLKKVRKPPSVPINRVPDQYDETGENVIKWRMEANDADPQYKQDVKDYEDWLAETAGYRLLDIIVSTCIIIDPDDLDDGEIVAHRRALLKTGPSEIDEPGEYDRHRQVVENMTDEEVFTRCVCLSTPHDMSDLQRFVMGRSMPTVEEVDEQIESFQPAT